MKRIIVFIFLVAKLVTLNAQNILTINFETLDSAFYAIVITDSTLDSTGLWQTGKPMKTVFDSSYSGINAMVTDTVNTYPVNVKSSFILKTKTTQMIYSGLSFWHKIDADSLNDGGYVEFSVDSGVSWFPITTFQDYETYNFGNLWFWRPEWYGDGLYSNGFAMLPDSNRFITGSYPSWIYSQISFPCWAVKTAWFDTIEVWFKFTFVSDSIADNKEGWMIDDLRFTEGLGPCSGIEKTDVSDNIDLQPNPSENEFIIHMPFISEKPKITIYDFTGRQMTIMNEVEIKTNVDVRDFHPGIYFLVVETSNGVIARKRFLKK